MSELNNENKEQGTVNVVKGDILTGFKIGLGFIWELFDEVTKALEEKEIAESVETGKSKDTSMMVSFVFDTIKAMSAKRISKMSEMGLIDLEGELEQPPKDEGEKKE